jgi:hypothetical protein
MDTALLQHLFVHLVLNQLGSSTNAQNIQDEQLMKSTLSMHKQILESICNFKK